MPTGGLHFVQATRAHRPSPPPEHAVFLGFADWLMHVAGTVAYGITLVRDATENKANDNRPPAERGPSRLRGRKNPCRHH
ncbi:hypothetical protein R6L23_07425 [Streptomyces sp. SR27]|uniref:hypothetical protein n=1 Tax=Streptomyces sp. SR27 TaxID=3076630 RepID=UPI00295A8A1B|nr:hypothetical protein [Streptomyces sp. SR27]MDV9188048.1 hypothetical protein [Streptomyces sp. SR27]